MARWSDPQQPVAVVTGMRGVGKSHVAAAYARARITDGCPLVAWVNAETADSTLADLVRVAERLAIADPHGDSTRSVERLRDHLASREDAALIVLDNATDPNRIRALLPGVGPARIVITSVDRSFLHLGVAVDVDTYQPDQSIRFLDATTGLDDDAGAAAVAGELGHLPLALSVAAATISPHTGQNLTYSAYLRRLRERPLPATLERHAGQDYPHSVVASILLSVDTVEGVPGGNAIPDNAIRRILGLFAMLSSDGVDRSLLAGLTAVGSSGSHPETEPGADDESVIDAAVGRIVAGSLLSWSLSGEVLIMHRLVARILRERARSSVDTGANRQAVDSLVTTAIGVVERAVVGPDDAWSRRQFGSHVVAQIESVFATGLIDSDADADTRERAARLYARAVLHFIETADGARGIPLAHRAQEATVYLLGADHPDALMARNHLAAAYSSADKMPEAVALLEATLADRERILGAEHPDTLISRNNLAAAYESAGRVMEAIALHRAALAESERILGPDHPNTLSVRNNLASAYGAAGRLPEAIALFKSVVAESERVLGAEHPYTLSSRNNLASTYESAGRLPAAIDLFAATLADRERILGVDHPGTLISRNNLASAYRTAERWSEAIALLETTVAEGERLLGAEHPFTLSSRNNLASAYQSAGRIGEAITFYESTLADRTRIFGSDHPSTLVARNNLASAYGSAGRGPEAIDLFEATLADRERVLGADHPHTLSSRNNLASAYESAGRRSEAIDLFERTLADSDRILGPDHPDTLIVRNNLASVHESAGRVGEAVELFDIAVRDSARIHGAEHPITAATRERFEAAQRRLDPQRQQDPQRQGEGRAP